MVQGTNTRLVLTALVLIAFGQYRPTFAIDIDLKGMISSVLAPECAALAGTVGFVSCSNEYTESVKPFFTQDGKLPIPVACCAMTTLRYCVIDQIENTCGSTTGSVVDSIVKGLVGAAQYGGADLPCTGDEFYYRKESPVCWAVWGHALGAGLLLLLLVTLCCVCCRVCCCKSRKNRPIVVNLLPLQNPLSREVAYSRIENETQDNK